MERGPLGWPSAKGTISLYGDSKLTRNQTSTCGTNSKQLSKLKQTNKHTQKTSPGMSLSKSYSQVRDTFGSHEREVSSRVQEIEVSVWHE